jgi:CBS domain containing-hemolysin-like protein
MTISTMAAALRLEPVQDEYDDNPIGTAYTSDLLSDVMGNAPEAPVLITIQAHKNTIAVATLKDAPAIIICNNRPIPDDMKEAARAERIAVFVTAENQFTISGKLYALLEC